MNSDMLFEEIYNETKQSALRFITSKCLSITDIEDLFQETYLRVYDALESGRRPEQAEAFVIGIAKHCLSHYYSAAQRLKARISLSAGKLSDEPVDIGDDTDIEGLIADRILLNEVFNEITKLPPDAQRIFYLHYFLELSLPDTAALVGLSEGKVRQKLYKAVRQLRRKYRRR